MKEMNERERSEECPEAMMKRLKDENHMLSRRIEDMEERYWRDVARRETYYSNSIHRLYGKFKERIAEKDAENMELRRKLAESGFPEYGPGSVEYLKKHEETYDGLEEY